MKVFKAIVSAASVALLLSACSLSDLVDVDKPQEGAEIDHDYLDTRNGALSVFYSALATLQSGVSKTSLQVGIFTDELTARPSTSSDNLYFGRANDDPRAEHDLALDLKGITYNGYSDMQATRARAGHARYFLSRQADLDYAVSGSFAFEGYAIVTMAENLCSGIPLSEAPLGKPAVYGKALSTDSLFKIAIIKFDSALAIDHDSARFKTLAIVGKARALVGLGRYSDAASLVSAIHPSDTYNLEYTQTVTPGATGREPADAFWSTTVTATTTTYNTGHEIVNLEGFNGLAWYTNATTFDPRLPVIATGIVIRQNKFRNGTVSLKFAGWIEAKMIEAEHLLNINDPNWVDPLNLARRTVSLPDLISPATTREKVDLLFRERALWFYGHGTRLADMRRLVRQYNRDVNTVFPIGGYLRSATVFSYGDAVVLIPDVNEFNNNYNYSGCINRNP